jgi:glycosyltransferase involved in cell wall biosynthesis
MTKSALLIYTDCYIFAGCENVLANIINSKEIAKNYKILYSFNNYRDYREVVKDRAKGIDLYPLNLLSNGSLFYKINLKIRNRAIRRIIKFPLWFIQKIGVYAVFNFFKLFSFFKAIRPDILFINNGGYPGAQTCRVAVFSAKFAGIENIIFNVNNIAEKQNGFFDRMVDQFIGKNVDQFITASTAAKSCLSTRRLFDIKKCINIANTLPDDYNNVGFHDILRNEYNIDHKTIIIGSAGLLTQRKGYHILIDSIEIIIQRTKGALQFKVFIFGEGEERRFLEEQISRKNLMDVIFLPGYRDNIKEYLKCFDIFVLPSIGYEDLPYVILEAMSLGKPIIGTNVAGIPEQIDQGMNGFVCEAGNATCIANAIINLLEDDDLSLKMGDWSRMKYKNTFNYSMIMNEYLLLFNRITAN